jgi:hypothetical protein
LAERGKGREREMVKFLQLHKNNKIVKAEKRLKMGNFQKWKLPNCKKQKRHEDMTHLNRNQKNKMRSY